jgi:hypothetical protein
MKKAYGKYEKQPSSELLYLTSGDHLQMKTCWKEIIVMKRVYVETRGSVVNSLDSERLRFYYDPSGEISYCILDFCSLP